MTLTLFQSNWYYNSVDTINSLLVYYLFRVGAGDIGTTDENTRRQRRRECRSRNQVVEHWILWWFYYLFISLLWYDFIAPLAFTTFLPSRQNCVLGLFSADCCCSSTTQLFYFSFYVLSSREREISTEFFRCFSLNVFIWHFSQRSESFPLSARPCIIF